MQQNLLARCPDELPAPAGKTGADLILMAKDWSAQYHECVARHNGLVEVLK